MILGRLSSLLTPMVKVSVAVNVVADIDFGFPFSRFICRILSEYAHPASGTFVSRGIYRPEIVGIK